MANADELSKDLIELNSRMKRLPRSGLRKVSPNCSPSANVAKRGRSMRLASTVTKSFKRYYRSALCYRVIQVTTDGDGQTAKKFSVAGAFYPVSQVWRSVGAAQVSQGLAVRTPLTCRSPKVSLPHWNESSDSTRSEEDWDDEEEQVSPSN